MKTAGSPLSFSFVDKHFSFSFGKTIGAGCVPNYMLKSPKFAPSHFLILIFFIDHAAKLVFCSNAVSK